MKRHLLVVLLTALCSSKAMLAEAPPQVFTSGPGRVSLVELYTSEGCSSCPPAEAWLAARRHDPGLWTTFVPVAFHVVYWDKLGWRDTFASKEFTQRQYAYGNVWGSRSVYTPCFVRDGAEWRPTAGAEIAAQAGASPGVLTVTYQPEGAVNVVYRPTKVAAGAAGTEAYEATVAWLAGGIVSSVKAGENAGRQLRHDFVATRTLSVPLRRGAGADAGTWTGSSAAAVGTGATRAVNALAAWVTPRAEQTPLQAAGGWLAAGDNR